jgi:hypothetical protein
MAKRSILAPWRVLTFVGVLALAAASTYAGDDVVQARMKKDIFFLASEECEGRGVGTKGIDKAADYIVNQITQAGLKPAGKDGTWFQPFTIGKGGAPAQGTGTITLKGPTGQTVELKAGTDYRVLNVSATGKADADVVFAGYGLSVDGAGYNDFKGIDVKGKVVVVLRRVPRWDNQAAPFGGDRDKYAGVEKRIENSELNKAAAVILVNDRSEVAGGDTFTAAAGTRQSSIPVVQLKRGLLDTMLVSGNGTKLSEVEADIDRDLKPRSTPIKGWSANLSTTAATATAGIPCKNIIGTLEGAGPLAKETIVVGAHYDHLGFGQGKTPGKNMYPGADDNGSGSTTIMELARRFGAMKNRQGRRLVFIWFSAEERGLLGSKHYVSEPLFPLESTAAMVNLDMVGRLKEGKEPELYAEGFATGKGLNELLEKLNADFGFKIVGPHKQQIYGRSDQASFYNKGIPGMFFFTDFHADYHKPGDTPDKINVPGMAKVAGLAEKLVAYLTTVQQRPEYVAGAINKGKGGGAKKQAVGKLGVTPDAADKSDKGVLIEAVAANGPAAKGGMMAGDRIIAINGTPTPTTTAYLSIIQSLRAGTVAEVTVQRKEMELKLKITPE